MLPSESERQKTRSLADLLCHADYAQYAHTIHMSLPHGKRLISLRLLYSLPGRQAFQTHDPHFIPKRVF